ncbi:MAG: hypothetical protein IPM51_13330 [Sphingobacteriaceae bacterium]|nr:hypothetical protein [Sphingobacteriaceae bacterium]
MKKIIFFSLLFLVSVVGKSQNVALKDTLYMVDGKKITCKIYEINEYEMRCRIGDENGPIYTFDKFKVRKYILSGGFSEIILPDELSLEQEHASIINNRQVIKIHPFSSALNHISFAYEKVIRVGMNLDVQAGFINSSIVDYGSTSVRLNIDAYHVGAYFKPGLKFFIGQDYAIKGMRYAHPLKGTYIKLDLAYSFLNYQDVSARVYNYQNSGAYTQPTYSIITTDINTYSYGGFINFGRQVILGNLLTLDCFVGIGYSMQSFRYTNSEFSTALNSSSFNAFYAYGEGRMNNYYGWLRVPVVGVSFTGGLRLGYIIPSKKKSTKSINQ